MRDPEVATAPFEPGLAGLLGALHEPAGRAAAAAALARQLGGDALLFFAPDPELGVPLPAPGLPQTLRGAAQWRDFLARCAEVGEHDGVLPGPDGSPTPARGCAAPDGTTLVLLGANAARADLAPLRPVLPLLGALFREERRTDAAQVRSRAAVAAVESARVLNRALQEMRVRLEGALAEAEASRGEAKARAEQAEHLAEELRQQAGHLQEQAVELEMLNDELATRTDEAERARATADAASRAKSDFLATMSHELRTPINAIIGYSELLAMGLPGPVTPEQSRQLGRIRASSRHLLALVNDVLDLARVEAGKMSLRRERESLPAVVDEAMALVEVQALARRIALGNVCDDLSATYLGDRHRVRQIVSNLLTNAVKFTEPGGAIRVRSGVASAVDPDAQLAGPGPWAFVRVEDTGIGITPEAAERVFQPFIQADSGYTRRHEGTGLGLTISRHLARLMGGDLTLRSDPGEGSCFTLWLPVEAG